MSEFIPINADAIPSSYSAQGPLIPVYNATQSTNPSVAGLPLDLGAKWTLDGKQYQCVFIEATASTTLSAGVLLTKATPATGTVTAAGSTVQVINVSATLVANAEVGNYIYFSDLALRQVIKANTTSSVTVSLTTSLVGNNKADPDVLPSVPANGSAYTIIRRFHVILGAAVPAIPVGVLLNDTDISLGAKVIMQIAGVADVLANNTGAATVVGSLAIPIASGIASGGTPAGGYTMVAAVAYNSASTALVPFDINFTGV